MDKIKDKKIENDFLLFCPSDTSFMIKNEYLVNKLEKNTPTAKICVISKCIHI